MRLPLLCHKRVFKNWCSSSWKYSIFCCWNVTICGIPMPKNSIISFNQIARQFNLSEWHNPLSFIPERFDPTNDIFKIPGNNGKIRDFISYTPFSFGTRSCPGQALAMLEIKLAVVIILSKFSFEIDDELLSNDHAKFPVGSTFKLKWKLTKR